MSAPAKHCWNVAAGADVFVFSDACFSNDVIQNFSTAMYAIEYDLLRFADDTTEVGNFADFVAPSTQAGNNIVYDPGDDDLNTITILNTFLVNPTVGDFSFPQGFGSRATRYCFKGLH